MPTPDPMLDRLIRNAIEHRRLLRFRYLNRDRIVEPHDYGIIGGSIDLFTFQIGGSSSKALPDWRLMFVNGISDAHMLDQTFPGGRPRSARHLKWDQLFLRVKPASQE